MPIHLPEGLRRLSDSEYKQVTYEVMEAAFAVHDEMGSLFDEPLYSRAVAQRIKGSQREVPIDVIFETFRKTYYLDLLVANGAVFELKAAEALVPRHRAQLMHYLLLAELPHGKLVNFHRDLVEHEFVNAPLSYKDRITFEVHDSDYRETQGGARSLKELLLSILRDWGTCLDIVLYQEALIHFLGGPERAIRPVEIRIDGVPVGQQKLNMLSPDTSVCVSIVNEGQSRYEQQLRRFLNHTSLAAIQWVNIGQKVVTFKTIQL